MSAGHQASVARLRIFTEARLHRAPDRTIKAIDAGSGPAAWGPYRHRVDGVQIVARVGGPSDEARVDLGDIAVYPLPYMHGPLELLARGPHLVRAVSAALQPSILAVVRLPGAVGVTAGLMARIRRVPYVVEVLGDPESLLRSGTLGRAGGPVAPIAREAVRWIVAGAVGGRYVTARTLQRKYPLRTGRPEHHYSNVRLGVDDIVTRSRAYSAPAERLLAVGTQDQLYKGHDDLIRAVALLRRRGRPVRLTLVGGGRWHRYLSDLAAEHGIADDVTFAGRVNDRGELNSLLDEADLFVHPSRTEGLPRALIEAMARALPAVGTSVGGTPELLPTEWLVDPGAPDQLADAIDRLAGSPRTLTQQSADNLRLATTYSLDEQYARMSGWLDFLDERVAAIAPSRTAEVRDSSTVVHVFGAMDRAGAELRTTDLARRITGVDHVYVTLTGRPGELAERIRRDGGRIRPCRLSPTFPLRFVRLLREESPDVVVSNVATFSGAILLLAALARVPRRVAHLRSDGDLHGGGPRRALQRGLMRALIALCATDIVGNAPRALAFGRSRVFRLRGTTAVVPDGVAPAESSPPATIESDVIRLVHIARPLETKRRPRAVQVLAAGRRAGLDLVLEMVGPMTNDERVQLGELALSLGVAAYVNFLGAVENVDEILSRAHALLVTSTREGLPGVVLEALAVGCPVVASALPGVTFIAEHCDGVIAVEPYAADAEWVDGLERLGSPSMPDRTQIWRSFGGSPFAVAQSADGVRALWQ